MCQNHHFHDRLATFAFYRVSGKKVPLLIEILVRITPKIQLKGGTFFPDIL